MKQGMVFGAVVSIGLLSVMGCRSSDSAIPPPTTENIATERRRIESDPSMPPVAKQAALENLKRRERETKK